MLSRLPKPVALIVAALLMAAALWCFAAPGQSIDSLGSGNYSDVKLYHEIVARVAAGEPYVRAATELQRAHGYPTRPFVTVREPTLYLIAAHWGWDQLHGLALLLISLNLIAWFSAWPAGVTIFERLGAVAGIAIGGLAATQPRLMSTSELWCGLLISLALALSMNRRAPWWSPIVVIAAALALRELALPFALLAMAFALWERHWRELAAWGLVLGLFALGLMLHAQAVAAQIRPTDLVSAGWTGGQGLRGVLMAIVYTSALQPLWQPLALLLSLLPLLGWLTLDGHAGRFALALLVGYVLLIALFARPDNFYWGFLLLPTWFAGWALVPRGIAQLTSAITRPRR